MMEEPNILEENWRNADGTWKAGHPSTGGRPKGSTLKEYQAQKFREMNDEEKEQYLLDIQKELRWRMAEGNPATNTDLTTKGEKIVFPILGGITNEIPEDNSCH